MFKLFVQLKKQQQQQKNRPVSKGSGGVQKSGMSVINPVYRDSTDVCSYDVMNLHGISLNSSFCSVTYLYPNTMSYSRRIYFRNIAANQGL